MDRIALILHRTCRASQMKNLVTESIPSITYIMMDEIESRVLKKVNNIFTTACREVIHTDDCMTLIDQTITKM